MRVRPVDAAAGTDAPAAARPAAGRAQAFLRVTLITLFGVSLLAAVVVFAYALAAARVPEQRATLEDLVHAETGLDVRFSELRLRWGWYGPEAVFRAVELYEPGRSRPLLTAPKLVVGVDLWRMLRSGEVQIGRITLVDPNIDATRGPSLREARAGTPVAPARLLSRWRGTRIDVEGGTLRADVAGIPLAAGIRRIQLRRAGAEWSADALLALPDALGTTVQAALRLNGDATPAAELTGTLTLSSQRLQLAGWRSLLDSAPAGEFLPAAGSADVMMQFDLAHGGVTRVQGAVAAMALEWPAAGSTAGIALDALRGDWQLLRTGGGWHLAVQPLALGAGSPNAALSIDAAADGAWVRGRVQRAPAALLAGLARGLMPQLGLAGVGLSGTVREASFDWSSARAPNARLQTAAVLDGLSVALRGGALTLAGLTAHLQGTGASLEATLEAGGARLTRAADPAFTLAQLALRAQLAFSDNGRAWRVSTRALEIRRGDARLAASGALTGEDSGAHPRLDARITLSGAPVETVRAALGARALAALGTTAGELTAGRIEHAVLVARGPLDVPLPWTGAHQEFTGSLELGAASLAGAEDWPDLQGLDARIDWRAARVRVRVDHAAAGGAFRLLRARGEWNARDASLRSLTGRLAGNAADALAWLRDHPRFARYAPGIDGIALRGQTLLDFDVRRAPGPTRDAPRFDTRLTALLDGAQLRPVAGLPGIESLRGTLAFADARLQHSTLTGKWLGGPVALSVAERRERGATAIAIAGRGLLNVRETLAAATGASAAASPLEGSAEWTAELRLIPGKDGGRGSWRARADTSLAGIASGLPEPFAKAPGSVVPLHVELLGTGDAGELRVALGERLRAIVAVSRRGDLWQIERGAVNFGAGAPAMPATPVILIEGTMSRLDLPGYLSVWRQLARSPAWPSLRVELTAGELLAPDLSIPDVHVAADAGLTSGELRLEAADLDARVRWPALVDPVHPVSAHLERLDLAQLGGGGAAAALIGALGSDSELSVADLRWRGRSLGSLEATLAARAGALEVSDLHVTGPGGEARGTLRCRDGACRASFGLSSRDAAATLTRLGFRADLSAAHAAASGTLEWPTDGTPVLASAKGQIHVELADGLTRSAIPGDAPAAPLGLLAVPGLVAGMGLPQLPFARLAADFTVADGQAVTSDLHLDGDTEILMRGRIGLLARDYEAQVWVMKGEERLPAALRRLGPGPRVAALWLSLRELFAGGSRPRAALRLHGTWDDPMVSP